MKRKKEKSTRKTRQTVQVPEDAEFLDETDDGGMYWTEADFTCLARADSECPTRRSSGSTKSQWYTLNVQCVAYKGIVAQERFRNISGKAEEESGK
ncbi:hypothetical protein GIB67_042974 [Kingdonia uniflora]|uniref:Uncharacterized protein n=1 Tax=Kingdonia uniflora TaxID=39325 RepID=A0A7J7NTH3_9MAGN|nr:hypothetical protein GIB67_042974 [Kingdonia uniflora]